MPRQVDRNKLISFLEGLTNTQLDQILVRIPGSSNHVPAGELALQRVLPLIVFAESTGGPGLKAIADAINLVFPNHPLEIRKTGGQATLPPRNPFFTGRDQEISSLRNALTSGRAAALTQAISGLGGIGKTAIAVEYAHAFADQYDVRLFARAESMTTLTASYRDIAEQLELQEAALPDDEEVIRSVKNYMNTAVPSTFGKMPFLLILDNADFVGAHIADTVRLPDETRIITVEELTGFLPEESKGHILLTTRAESLHGSLNIPVGNVLSLKVMAQTEAEQFLLERKYGEGVVAPDEAAAARELANALGFLPLALEQTAAYVTANSMRAFQNYLAVYRAQEKQDMHIPKQLENARPESGRYEKTIATTWQISFDAVEEMNPASADLMRLCAFLGPNTIPFELVITAASSEDMDKLTEFFGNLEDENIIEQQFTELLGPLLNYSLVTPGIAPRTLNIHRLVQAVTRWKMDAKTQQQWIKSAIEVLNTSFPYVEFENWAMCERLTPHVQVIAEWVKRDKYFSRSASRLLNQAACYLNERGRYTEAEPLFDEALQIYNTIFPQGHPSIARSLNNLGMLYKSQGRYTESIPLLAEALQIRRVNLPEGHPDIAQSLNNLAALYDSQERYAEAEPLFDEALQIRKASLPQGHPNIARSLNNLGMLYKSQGRDSEAEPLLREALQIRRVSLPQGHSNIGSSLNNLGMLYDSQGRYTEAEPLLREALQIFRVSLGTDHPNTRVVAENLEIFQQLKETRNHSVNRNG